MMTLNRCCLVSPIERVDIPEHMGYLSVLSGRQIKVIDVNDCYSADLYGVNGVDVYCSRTSCLNFSANAKARLIRSADSVGLDDLRMGRLRRRRRRLY